MTQEQAIPYHPLLPQEGNSIDGLRGFLCFYVFGFHFYANFLQGVSGTPKFFYTLFDQGYVSVKVFFALSGLLIFHSYSKNLQHQKTHPIKFFFTKRAFRILPAWFFALFIYSIDARRFGVSDFFWNFFLLFGFAPFKFADITVIQSWSLYVEESFYICFPFFIYLFRKKISLPFVLLFLLAGVLFNSLYKIPPDYQFYSPLNTFHYFLYGIVAYLCVPYLRMIYVSYVVMAICILSIGVASLTTSLMDQLLEVYVLFCFLFIFCGPKEINKPFNIVFKPLGRICYSFYLMHLIAVRKSELVYNFIFSDLINDKNLVILLQIAVAFALALLFSIPFYYLIEKPSIRLGQKVSSRLF